MFSFLCRFTFLLFSLTLAYAAPEPSSAAYDLALCETAQRIIANAPELPVRVQRGTGNGFHTIQMSVDSETATAVVAMTMIEIESDEGPWPVYVACKMVDRERVSDQLQLDLPEVPRSCRDVNIHTWQVAWRSLTDAERQRYAEDGRPLVLEEDEILPSGGAWLPARAEDYIDVQGPGFAVRAPSVRVPWDRQQREFFQGIRHCKLLTLSAMRYWLRDAAFRPDGRPVPADAGACRGPARPARLAGSCVFYFAPMNARYCEDYNGPGWTRDAAMLACGRRHASREALQSAGNRYEGAGGSFSERPCRSREDAPAITGSCVFNCGTRKETTWQVTGPRNGMLDRACDLYMPVTSSAVR